MELKKVMGGGTVPLVVQWQDEDVKVQYDPNVFTPRLVSQLEAAQLGGKSMGDALVGMLDKLLADWDITQDGEPFPPSPDNIATLPMGFLVAVIQGVAQEMQVGPLSSGTSAEPS